MLKKFYLVVLLGLVLFACPPTESSLPILNMKFTDNTAVFFVDQEIEVDLTGSEYKQEKSKSQFKSAILEIKDSSGKLLNIEMPSLTATNYAGKYKFKIAEQGEWEIFYSLENTSGEKVISKKFRTTYLKVEKYIYYGILNETYTIAVALHPSLVGKNIEWVVGDGTVIDSTVEADTLSSKIDIKKVADTTLTLKCESRQEIIKFENTFKPKNNLLEKEIDGKKLPLRFAENFNTTLDDLETRWLLIGADATKKLKKRAYWQKEALAIKDGILEMHIKEDSSVSYFGKVNDWIAGGIHQNKNYTYGYFEAKIKMKKTSEYHWDAFWSYDAGTSATPLYYEFDMMEYTGTSNVMDQTTHWWKKEGGRYVFPSKTFHPEVGNNAGNLNEWFILGLYWTPEKVEYYINGELSVGFDSSGEAYHKTPPIKYTGKYESLTAIERGRFIGDKYPVITKWPQNFKFTSELGKNYGSGLPATGTDDIMYVDYFINYEYID